MEGQHRSILLLKKCQLNLLQRLIVLLGFLKELQYCVYRILHRFLQEDQAKQLISEANSTGTSSKEEWNGVALPLVRTIYGEISPKEFVSVQPMNLPSGLVFWLDFKYGTNSLGD
jgi:hypothetical protein